MAMSPPARPSALDTTDQIRLAIAKERMRSSPIYCDMCRRYPGYPGDGLRFCVRCDAEIAAHGGDIGAANAAISEAEQRRETLDKRAAGVPMSPPEALFWDRYVLASKHPADLTPQHVVGRYRLDFADPGRMLAIEVDGLAYHNGQESFIKDQRRQRDLQALGWTVVRFAAKEVLDDPSACLREVARLVGNAPC